MKKMEWIRSEGDHFIQGQSGKRFVAWGLNYDHDHVGRLLEDYWEGEWESVVEDFWEMKALGANAVRVHLQVAKFMESAEVPNSVALEHLSRLVDLAEETGLYLDITGLGCYHKQDVPIWYDALSERERWQVQACFWEAIAKTCSNSPSVFCYDLMNEPVLPGEGVVETDWLVGKPLGGKYFVQRITLDLRGRTRQDVVREWVTTLVSAIRRHDSRHLITVGEIPWAAVFPGAKSVFHPSEEEYGLDFVSVHFYPESGKTDQALAALFSYDIGKPLVVEEMFPLKCSIEDLQSFVDGSRDRVSGYFGFYWGRTIDEYSQPPVTIQAAILKAWLEYFRDHGSTVLHPTEAK